jgi:hypothetical protein
VNQPRNIGVALLALAIFIYLTVTAPGYDAAADARRQHDGVRRETEDTTRRLAEVERRAAFLTRATALMSQTGGAAGDSIQRVRVGIVRTLRESGISHVRLEVRPASSGGVAAIALAADAGFFDLLDLVSRLARPGSGIVLRRATFGGEPSSVTIEAVAIGAAAP